MRQHRRVDRRRHQHRERRAHRRHRQQVAAQRGADARMARRRGLLGAHRAFGPFGAEAVRRAGHAAADRLAEHDRVGLQAMRTCVAAGAAADGVGFVEHQRGAVVADQRLRGAPVAGLGQHHADVGQRRLGQHASDVAAGQRGFECGEVVELDDHGVRGEVVDLAEQAVALGGPARDQVDEHVVDGAVVAAVEDDQLAPPAGRAQPAQHEPVGIGGRRRELPERQPEALGQQLTDHGRVFAGQHRGQAARGLARHRLNHRCRRVAEHRAGVAEAEVDQRVAVRVDKLRARGLCHLQRERRAPVVHPVQRHAEHQVSRGSRGQFARARVARDELGALMLQQGLRAHAIDTAAGRNNRFTVHRLPHGLRVC